VEGIDRLLHTILRPDFLSQRARPLHHLGVGRGSQDYLGEPLDLRWALDIKRPEGYLYLRKKSQSISPTSIATRRSAARRSPIMYILAR